MKKVLFSFVWILLLVFAFSCNKSTTPTQPLIGKIFKSKGLGLPPAVDYSQFVLLTSWGSSGSGDSQFQGAQAVAVSNTNFVYVADLRNQRVQKFDSNGTFLTKWGSVGTAVGQFEFPRGIAVDSTGSVYVADTSNNRVQKFDSNGNFLTKWGSLGDNPGQFNAPAGIVANSTLGTVYVGQFNSSNIIGDFGAIQAFNLSGTFLFEFLAQSSANHPGIADVAIDDLNNIFTVDLGSGSQGVPKVRKFDSSGNLILSWGQFGNGPGHFIAPDGMTVDGSNNVIVADPQAGSQVFDNLGNFIFKFNEFANDVFVGPDG